MILESDAADPTSSPLLVAALGGDELLFLIDAAGALDDVDWDRTRLRQTADRARESRPWDELARQAGESIVLADLADDDRLHPLARIAAAVELAVSTASEPDRSRCWRRSRRRSSPRLDVSPTSSTTTTSSSSIAKDAAVLQSLLRAARTREPVRRDLVATRRPTPVEPTRSTAPRTMRRADFMSDLAVRRRRPASCGRSTNLTNCGASTTRSWRWSSPGRTTSAGCGCSNGTG